MAELLMNFAIPNEGSMRASLGLRYVTAVMRTNAGINKADRQH